MSASESQVRRDGWTAARQLRFLDALVQTGSITRAATAAGISRESAYRLRARRDGALFAALWDRALAFQQLAESHAHAPANGLLMRLLGNQFRRKAGDFADIGKHEARSREPDRTRHL